MSQTMAGSELHRAWWSAPSSGERVHVVLLGLPGLPWALTAAACTGSPVGQLLWQLGGVKGFLFEPSTAARKRLSSVWIVKIFYFQLAWFCLFWPLTSVLYLVSESDFRLKRVLNMICVYLLPPHFIDEEVDSQTWNELFKAMGLVARTRSQSHDFTDVFPVTKWFVTPYVLLPVPYLFTLILASRLPPWSPGFAACTDWGNSCLLVLIPALESLCDPW